MLLELFGTIFIFEKHTVFLKRLTIIDSYHYFYFLKMNDKIRGHSNLKFIDHQAVRARSPAPATYGSCRTEYKIYSNIII